MAKARLEDTLHALSQWAERGDGPETRDALARALASTVSHVVAKAASVARQLQIDALDGPLWAAFDRFMIDPGKTDKGCRAKEEIAATLYELGAAADSVFTRGIRHVQMEPVFGGRADTAIHLRGHCALGLVRMGHPDALIELADLLADREAGARVMAARALGYSQSPDAVPLLRFKARTGDADAQVVGECFAGLLKIHPRASVEFVAGFLEKGGEVSEQAALALGGSRLAEALPHLTRWADRLLEESERKVAMIAIGTLRCDAAVAYLLTRVEEGTTGQAAGAIEGLSIYRHDPSIVARARKAVESRGERAVRQAFDEALG